MKNSKIQQLQKDFEEEIGSCSSFAINIDKLSCGAKIKHIFHDTYVIFNTTYTLIRN